MSTTNNPGAQYAITVSSTAATFPSNLFNVLKPFDYLRILQAWLFTIGLFRPEPCKSEANRLLGY